MRYFAALFILFVSFSSLNAQCPSRIEFNAQSQIDQFPLQYPNCTEIPGEVIIRTSEFFPSDIVNLNGLLQINSIGGNLIIHANAKLETLEGLDNLETVYGDVRLSYNETLKDISSLGLLSGVAGEIAIYHNPILSECSLEVICTLLNKNQDAVTIFNNGPNCNSIEEVYAACSTTSIEENFGIIAPQVYPNPVQNQLQITIEDATMPANFFLYNTSGNLIKTNMLQSSTETIDFSALPSGMYILSIQHGNHFYTHKISKEN